MENNETIPPQDEKENQEFDPIEEIKKIKENSVSKIDYEKVVAERDKYCKALIDGVKLDKDETKTNKAPVDIDALRKDLFTKDLSNLEFTKKALALRNEIIEKQGVDIFVGSGEKLTPTQEDYNAAQRVADGLQSCIEVSDGNSEIFTRELMRITKDVSLPGKINPKIKM